MTALADLLVRRILANGPITLADYMTECLLHPEYGYYATRDPFGTAGDFTTAPEISQMFGELLGLSLAQVWIDQGRPAHFTLAELGPGRGTLMADVLRATAGVAGFHKAADIYLVEASATLREIQRRNLQSYNVTWADHAEDLPEAPLFLLANEFFDALPIRQFQRTLAGWSETLIGVANDELSFGRGPDGLFALLDHRLTNTQPNEIVEICPSSAPIMDALARRIETQGGIAVIIDYGDWVSRGDTFQALKSHDFTPPLAAPGEADLTAHVDFAALAARCKNTAYKTQGQLLNALGLQQRAEILAKRLTGEAALSHRAATRRLTAPEEMGKLFKALAVLPPAAPIPFWFI